MNTDIRPRTLERDNARARSRRILALYGLVFVAVGIPFSFVHLAATPDDAAITPLQHMAAAAANCSGPWGVLLVRVVHFPNAGLRAFSWPLAVGMTLVAGVLILLPGLVPSRLLQNLAVVLWALFVVVWFTVGLMQIASGLL